MASHQDVQDFFELRAGLLGMRAFAEGALALLDTHGIALAARPAVKPTGRPSNGNVNGHRRALPALNVATLREQVKRHYTRSRPAAAPEPALAASDKITRQRQISAATLALFHPIDPHTPETPLAGLGALVRRGYLKRKGKGYVRTTKVFDVQPAKKTTLSREIPADTPDTPSDALTVREAAQALQMSDANVRLLVKQGKLAGSTETRVLPGMKTPRLMQVIARNEVARYAAEIAAL